MKRASEQLIQMLEICIIPGPEKGKQCQKICNQLLNQIHQNKQIKFNVTISSGHGKSAEPNQTFILQCILWSLLKFRSLDLCLILRSGSSKSKSSSSLLDLTLSTKQTTDLSKEFYNYLDNLQCENTPREIKNFLEEINVTCKIEGGQEKLKSKSLNAKPEIYRFISQIYSNLRRIFPNNNVYLNKNTLVIFSEDNSQDKKCKEELEQDKIKLIHQFKRMYSLQWYLKGFDPSYLRQLAINEESKQKAYHIEELLKTPNQEQRGFFKEFPGTPNEYLEKLSFGVNNPGSELENISMFLQSTPNIGFLYVIYESPTVIDNVEPLLQSIAKNTTLMESVSLIKGGLNESSIIPNSLLLKVYEECPFLSQLDLGQRFTFKLPQTYNFTSPEDRDRKERERQARIILEALRLRKITLKHNYQMAKVLLKKKFNYMSTLQIVNTIEPICL